MILDVRCAIDWPGTMSFLKDLVTATAACVATVIAWRGLSTWQRQTIGQQHHDLARKLLVGAYRYREAIRRHRSPVMWAGEMPEPPPEKAGDMSWAQKRHYGRRGAYLARQRFAIDAWNAIQPDLLEAEALWGEEVKRLFRGLMILENELTITIEAHLTAENPDEEPARREAYQQIIRQRRDIIYDTSTPEEPDEFESDLRNAVSAIETGLRPRLIRQTL